MPAKYQSDGPGLGTNTLKVKSLELLYMGDYVGPGHNVIESDCNFVRHCIFVDKYEMFIMFAFVNLSAKTMMSFVILQTLQCKRTMQIHLCHVPNQGQDVTEVFELLM